MANGKIILVSNRLPVEHVSQNTESTWRPSPGGLANALSSALRPRGGRWIGWPGAPGDHRDDPGLQEAGEAFGVSLHPVAMSDVEEQRFYRGFANEIIWPLFHDLHPYCDFDPTYWDSYQAMVDRFADAVASQTTDEDTLWIHDYHLMGVGQAVRERGIDAGMAFFLHIPFPSLDAIHRIPWHHDIIRSLTHYDRVGFQTRKDAAHFVEAVVDCCPDASVQQAGDDLWIMQVEGRTVEAGSFPIGIDLDDVHARSQAPDVDAAWRRWTDALPDHGHKYIVGLERLDYTKGILERLRGFRRALQQHPELQGKVTLLQHVDPSRQGVSKYAELRRDIECEVGRINGEFSRHEWVPVRYSFRHLDFDEVLALYRLAHVALVTPIRDGMNLVAKEYCAVRAEDGVLILSEFTGAAEQMHEGALVVNPHDINGVADAIHRACTMPLDEQRERMASLHAAVRRSDLHAWWHACLEGLGSPRIVAPN